jgi:hypothetical protein
VVATTTCNKHTPAMLMILEKDFLWKISSMIATTKYSKKYTCTYIRQSIVSNLCPSISKLYSFIDTLISSLSHFLWTRLLSWALRSAW